MIRALLLALYATVRDRDELLVPEPPDEPVRPQSDGLALNIRVGGRPQLILLSRLDLKPGPEPRPWGEC